MRILVVEDQRDLNRLIVKTLTREGYTVDGCFDGEEALLHLAGAEYDGVILDVMLPKKDGHQVLRELRDQGRDLPVLFLTARDSVADRVRGLRMGACDYIVKPFAPEELLARVDGLMRRTGRRSARLRLWQVEIDPDARQVLRDGRPVELTPREFDLLMVLAQSRGVALYRNVLMERVWGLDSDTGPRTLDLYISRLRKKLGWADKIRTVSGVGYRLEARP